MCRNSDYTLMATTKKIPRGIRNNNPLNIRVGNVWQGEVKNPTDPAFEQFISMKWGIRAGFVILRRYIRRYGNNTIRKIVSTWAPNNENNTAAYVDAVARKTGFNPDLPVRYEDKNVMVAIVAAMIQVECGQAVSDIIIQDAYEMA